jgi:hypothetical protein
MKPTTGMLQQRSDAGDTRRAFMRLVFDGCSGSVLLRAIDPDGRTSVATRFVELGDHASESRYDEISSAIDLLAAANPGSNIFIGLATRVDDRSGGKDNLRDLRVLWMDMDCYRENARDVLARRVQEGMPRPSMAVLSGGGLHLYWSLRRPYRIAPSGLDNDPQSNHDRCALDVARLESILRGGAGTYGGDINATDASRILRPAATINYPDAKKRNSGRREANVSVLYVEPKLQYSIDDFGDWERAGSQLARRDAVTERDWEIYTEGLSERVEMVLEHSEIAQDRFEGNSAGLSDTSQSGIEASFAAILRQWNTSLGEIEAALIELRARSGAKEKDESYFIRTVNLVRDLGYSIEEKFKLTEDDLKAIRAREVKTASDSAAGGSASAFLKLVQATTGLDWCADQFGDVIVSVPHACGWKHLSADSKAARDEVEAAHARVYKTVPKRETIDAFIATKKVEARDEPRRCLSARRVAAIDDRVYLDLAQGEIVEMTETGWRVVHDGPDPVRFLRTGGLLPLPRPEPGGSFDLLRRFANVDDDNFVLLVASLLGLALAKGPYIVLLLIGEHGSTKTTLARLLASIVDPREPSALVPSGKPEDVLVAAKERHVTIYDNVSRVQDWFSDILCCLATGAGYAKRKLYTDGEGSQLSLTRPQVLTSIEEAINRSDLLSRTVTVRLKRQPVYRTEEAVRADFEAVHPRLVGALCTAISTALGSRIEIDELPRMADFARFVARAEPALPWKPGTFMRLYRRRLGEGARAQVEASPVASALLELIEKQSSKMWEGHAIDLLGQLATQPSRTAAAGDKAWPRTPKMLRNVLLRLQSDLREFGLEIDLKVREDARGVVLRVWRVGADGPSE